MQDALISRHSSDYHSHFKAAREKERRDVDHFCANFAGSDDELKRKMHKAALYLLATRLHKDNQKTFRAPDLMAAKQFLRDMFGHGGLYAKVRIEEITFKPCEILWAPLLHLVAADRTCALVLQKPLFAYLGRIQLEEDPSSPSSELRRLDLNMALLSTRLGKVGHEILMDEARENFCNYMPGHTALPMLLPAGRLERLESWGVSLASVATRALDGIIESNPYPSMLRTMTDSLRQLVARMRVGRVVPDEQFLESLELALLRTGLNTYLMRKWDREEIRDLLGRGVVDCRQALSARK